MKKKTVLITGAGSGLGKMSAIELARRGHTVIATALYEKEVEEINKAAKEEKIDMKSFKLDITKKEDREKIVDIDFDVLINNAAIGNSGSMCEFDINILKEVYEVNIFSSILITQLAFKKFISKGSGRIIFISSLTGRVSMPFLSPYCSSKFAIESLVESLQMELKYLNKNIDVTLIEPGAYATGFNKENIEKMYPVMKDHSFFSEKLSDIKNFQVKMWHFIESRNYKSIIKKYVKAVETKYLKKRYYAPLIQYIFIKFMVILK